MVAADVGAMDGVGEAGGAGGYRKLAGECAHVGAAGGDTREGSDGVKVCFAAVE